MVMTVVETQMAVRGRAAKFHDRPDKKKPRHGAGLFFGYNPGLLGYDVGSAGALLALLNVEGYGLSFSQRLEAAALNGAVMDEYVFGAIGRCDEAEAFFVTEPLNCSCCHVGYLW